MPVIVNNFITKVLNFIREFFLAELFEIGYIDVAPASDPQTFFIPTQCDVLRVWISLTGYFDPYNEQFGHLKTCFVSEAVPVPGGFQFQAIVNGNCRINWFAIGTPNF